MYCIKAKF
ncbi:hypothetical protein CP02DC24_0297A, partial [Chlamydia psittaci 02DC24]